ncbi:MAG TPA: glycosyltransferase [Acidimicrobiales bacterium]|nr:glycosyltransferase [Acidimicrobiales bacterium]
MSSRWDGAAEVIVIHRDRPEACLATVRAFLGEGPGLHVTVVDNGSSPEAIGDLRRSLPAAVDLVENGHNLGFGPAANVGLSRWLARGTGEWAVIAPHDAQPVPGSVAALLETGSARPRAGVCCADYGDRGRPRVDRYLGGLVFPAPDGDAETWIPTDHPHGTMLALRRSCLVDVGLFDERYFAYVEEADLGLRAVAAGWDVGVVPAAVVINPHTSVARPVVEYLQLRNTLLLIREHFGLYPVVVRTVIAALSTLHQSLRPSRRAAWFDAGARMLAVADFARGRYGEPPASVAARP